MDLRGIVSTTAWTLYFSFHIVVVIVMGQKTTTEGKATAILVHRKMRESAHAEVTLKVLFT